MSKKITLFVLILMLMASTAAVFAKQAEKEKPIGEKTLVVWTSGDKEVATKMVFMYVFNAKRFGWVDKIQLLVWGPSAKLLSEDTELQEYVKKMKEIGVELTACKACADSYKVSDKLKALGVDVKYMGKDLTQMLHSDWKVLTF